MLHKKISVQHLRRPKRRRPLPDILTRTELKALFDNVDNLKHRAMLIVTYSCGLRVGEVVKIRLRDIDGAENVLHIRAAKGKKDRYVPISEKVLDMLREYWRQHRPADWLFPTQGHPDRHLSTRTVQKVFAAACQKAGIQKKVSVHSLRHCYATHLLEQGTDLRLIQEILGHASSRTTEIYTHVGRGAIKRVPSPMDGLL